MYWLQYSFRQQYSMDLDLRWGTLYAQKFEKWLWFFFNASSFFIRIRIFNCTQNISIALWMKLAQKVASFVFGIWTGILYESNFCVHLVFYFIFHFLRLTFVQNVRNMECLRKKICSQITATNAQDLNTIKSIPIIVRRDAMLFWRSLMKTRPPLLKLKQRRLFLIWDLWEIFLERSLWLLPINILSIDKSN